MDYFHSWWLPYGPRQLTYSPFAKLHHVQLSPPKGIQYASPSNVGTMSFDPNCELLWVGDNYGRISSYYSAQLKLYTALLAHPKSEGPVHQFLFNEHGVFSLATRSVHFMIRRALTQWHLEDDSMLNLACMCFLGKDSSQILVAGHQKLMYKVDAEKGVILEKVPTDAHYTMMKVNRHICAATDTGAINLLDLTTLQVVKSWQAHTEAISSMDSQKDFLITCGWSKRPHGPPGLDTLAKVYDLKLREQLSPISFQPGAKFVQIHPKMSTTSIVAAQTGQIHVADILNPNEITMLHAQLATSMAFMSMSPSGSLWAIADIDNGLSLWGSPQNPHFCDNPVQPEFADDPAPIPSMSIDSDKPLSSIGMPYYDKPLLSNWGYDRLFEVGRPSPTIDAALLKQARLQATGASQLLVVPNPHKSLRNQIHPFESGDNSGPSILVPKHISDKVKASDDQHSERRLSIAADAFARLALTSDPAAIPLQYEDLLISYGGTKGVADFDFEYYNNTEYSGLENHIANCYMNALLQVFKYTTLIRNISLQHVAGSCLHEGCLLCELGFLFDMLEKANGKACRATNFYKTYSSHNDALKTNTVEENAPRNTLDVRLLAATRFLLQRMGEDLRRVDRYDSSMDRILMTNGMQHYQCLSCQNLTMRQELSNVVNLVYPMQNPVGKHRGIVPSFSEVLRTSFIGEQQSRGWCQKCRRYAPMNSQRAVTGIAPVLVVNANLDKSPAKKHFWIAPNWLPCEIAITVEGGNVACHEGDQLRHFRNYPSTFFYELVGIVANATSGQRDQQKEHLISFIDVPNLGDDTPCSGGWHLFNDFFVSPVSTEVALNFSAPWKTPVILTYQLQGYKNNIDTTWKEHLDTKCLFYNGTMNHVSNPEGAPLDPRSEFPEAGTNVAIDAEFVVLQKETFEVPADGGKSKTIRPIRQALGRVSILRGSGPDEGTPFIDDYVIVHQSIVDYVTQYSGIEPGDLNPNSPRMPVSLKVTYKKLWLLLNLGCIFIGHGLYSDFRQINIHVPDTQVIDTVKLFLKEDYHLKLSLLAQYFLREEIQTGNHDSIEDARSALRLWRKYQEFEAKGTVKQMIDEVYDYRRKQAYDPSRVKKGHPRRGANGGTSSADCGWLAATGRMTPSGRATPDFGSRPATPLARGKGRDTDVGFESPLK